MVQIMRQRVSGNDPNSWSIRMGLRKYIGIPASNPRQCRRHLYTDDCQKIKLRGDQRGTAFTAANIQKSIVLPWDLIKRGANNTWLSRPVRGRGSIKRVGGFDQVAGQYATCAHAVGEVEGMCALPAMASCTHYLVTIYRQVLKSLDSNQQSNH